MSDTWENEGGAAIAHAFTGLAKGSDDEYCSATGRGWHHYVSHSVQAPPLRYVEICSLCQRINQGALREALKPEATAKAAEGEFTWLEILASRKRRPVADMKEIMTPIVEQLLREAIAQYNGWLNQHGDVWLSDELPDMFMREVQDDGTTPALDSGGPDQR